MKEAYIAKNVLDYSEIKQVYDHLMNNPCWHIGGGYANADNPILAYPRFVAKDPNGIHSEFIAAYMIATMVNVKQKIRDKYGFELPTHDIESVVFNAQRKGNIPCFHTDGTGSKKYSWSIIGFMTPQWDKSWGGELQIQEETFTFEPGDFIAFKSTELHDAMPILVDTPFYRLTCACMIP